MGTFSVENGVSRMIMVRPSEPSDIAPPPRGRERYAKGCQATLRRQVLTHRVTAVHGRLWAYQNANDILFAQLMPDYHRLCLDRIVRFVATSVVPSARSIVGTVALFLAHARTQLAPTVGSGACATRTGLFANVCPICRPQSCAKRRCHVHRPGNGIPDRDAQGTADEPLTRETGAASAR